MENGGDLVFSSSAISWLQRCDSDVCPKRETPSGAGGRAGRSITTLSHTHSSLSAFRFSFPLYRQFLHMCITNPPKSPQFFLKRSVWIAILCMVRRFKTRIGSVAFRYDKDWAIALTFRIGRLIIILAGCIAQ